MPPIIRQHSPHTTCCGDIQKAVINFFADVGVSLPAPKSVFYNDRQSTLTVHATADDLDLVEAAVDTLNIAPPEVTVKVRFVEVGQTDNKALGFQWYMGNFLMDGGRLRPGFRTGCKHAISGESGASGQHCRRHRDCSVDDYDQ